MKNIKGSLILLLTALIWGVAFVAQTSASDTVGSFTFNTARSAMASLFLLVVIGIRALINRKKTIGSKPVFSKPRHFVLLKHFSNDALKASAHINRRFHTL